MAHTESTEPVQPVAAGTAASAPAAAESPAGEHESPLHESSNISLRALMNFVVIFVVSAIVIHLVIYAIFAGFRAAVAQPREITGVSAEHIPPPEPRLEPSVHHNQLPSMDLEQLHAAEREEFASRGWIDPQTGAVRVKPEIAEQIAQMSRPKK